MRERRSDLWRLADEVKPDAVCFTSNGYVKRNGEAVMGRGCAHEAALRWPVLPQQLGDALRHYELRTFLLTNLLKRLWQNTQLPYHLVAFPVKPREVAVKEDKSNIVPRQRLHFGYRDIAPGWAAMADPVLIEQSARQLMAMIDANSWQLALLPRPGVGNGGLNWDREVKPLLASILDDRVIVVSQ